MYTRAALYERHSRPFEYIRTITKIEWKICNAGLEAIAQQLTIEFLHLENGIRNINYVINISSDVMCVWLKEIFFEFIYKIIITNYPNR